MDFNKGRRLRQKHIEVISTELIDLYPHDLQMYKIPPTNEISLKELEEMALERVQLLRIVEQASLKGHKLYSNEWKECIKMDTGKAGLKKFLRLLKATGTAHANQVDFQARRYDHISHFLLRLAYCRSEDLRRWFVIRELELFKLRFSELSNDGIHSFLNINKFIYIPITTEEKETLRDLLMDSIFTLHDSNFKQIDIYKVKFTEVCTLVKSRNCYLDQGFAYIPNTELGTCILTSYRAHLNESLAKTYKGIHLLNDERINDLLPALHNRYVGKTYLERSDKDSICIEDLDSYSKVSFPMCMRHMHESLRANHHLKHGSRLQYGLFIKGIGVKFEDALRFWRDEFTKLMDQEKFEKTHVYNIKHQYGKVGSMTNYSPHSCLKIINSSVNTNDTHGCPFKHWEPQNIKLKFISYGFNKEAVDEIVEIASKGHYQIACGKYFEYVHGQASKNVINHPNQYFEDSVAITKSKNSASTSSK